MAWSLCRSRHCRDISARETASVVPADGAVTSWNSWFPAFLYLDKSELFPVTIYLRNLIAGATAATSGASSADTVTQIAANVKSVTMVLSVLPVLAIYPFVQKYFVSGVMLGSVKQ